MWRLNLSIFLILLYSDTLATDYREIAWDNLIPETEIETLKKVAVLLTNPHLSMDMDVKLRQEILIAQSQLTNPEVKDVMNSVNVRPELNKQIISLPGFIVPLETNDEDIITEFFLVPYFGACIHVPPPPPNQIIFVRYKKGLKLQDISVPFHIKGTIFTKTLENDVALSAYTFSADDVFEYKE